MLLVRRERLPISGVALFPAATLPWQWMQHPLPAEMYRGAAWVWGMTARWRSWAESYFSPRTPP